MSNEEHITNGRTTYNFFIKLSPSCMFLIWASLFVQHGKYFLRILKHMQSKQKKLNDPLIPNLTKDQVCGLFF